MAAAPARRKATEENGAGLRSQLGVPRAAGQEAKAVQEGLKTLRVLVPTDTQPPTPKSDQNNVVRSYCVCTRPASSTVWARNAGKKSILETELATKTAHPRNRGPANHANNVTSPEARPTPSSRSRAGGARAVRSLRTVPYLGGPPRAPVSAIDVKRFLECL